MFIRPRISKGVFIVFSHLSRKFLAKFVGFAKSRRMGGHIINFRDGEGRCGRYCLLLEISLRAIARGFESLSFRKQKEPRQILGSFLIYHVLYIIEDLFISKYHRWPWQYFQRRPPYCFCQRKFVSFRGRKADRI